jgi:hypothetical protein
MRKQEYQGNGGGESSLPQMFIKCYGEKKMPEMTPEEKKEWERTHPIRDMVIQMNNAEPEDAEKLKQQSLEGSKE